MTQIGIIGSSRQRRVGNQALGSVGLGIAPMAMLGIDEAQAIATIHAALDTGVRLLDAATVYTPSVSSPGHSDRLVARALATWNGPRAEVIHVGKGGHRRVADGLAPSAFIIDGRPESIRADAETTLAAMGAEQIDLYLLHMPDPKVPLTESFGALLDLKREGKARMIGLSNVTLEQVQQVSRLGRIDAVENQYSILPICFSSQLPWTRDQSRPVLDWCESHDVAFLAYSPLGSVEAAGHLASRVPALGDVAATHAVSAQRVALAWLLRQSDHLLTIVGCRRVETAVDSALAMQLVLSADEINRIAVSVATSPADKQ